MRRCKDEKMWEDVRRCEKMWRWEDEEKMGGWEDVKMRRCEDEKMFYRPPLLEEPCAQTLSGKKTLARKPSLGWFWERIETKQIACFVRRMRFRGWIKLRPEGFWLRLLGMMWMETFGCRTQTLVLTLKSASTDTQRWTQNTRIQNSGFLPCSI